MPAILMSGSARPHPPLLAARHDHPAAGDPSRSGSDNHNNNKHNNNDHNNNNSGHPRPPRGPRPKRTLIESACSACRRRKSRCDGIRPACSRCQALRTDCAYEAEEGESRWSALRRRNQILETERAELRELLSYLQSRPEAEAQDIFARIRNATGQEDVFAILRDYRDADSTTTGVAAPRLVPSLPHQMSSLSTGSNSSSGVGMADQRLPPISSMFDVSGPPPPPPSSTGRPSLPSNPSGSSVHSQQSGGRGSMSYPFIEPSMTSRSPSS
ncbi:hypothetical protein M433DRAFT_362901 [Acidomyces richmondensis BFW]|nr:MAG: hypothetical protein FE78DRAFT_509337 [Acidomyces sp. 'richmondensis']KYG43312.1 hypothetical protein M433DRAFT_362901 [Acidomyces richmondensis BFW]